MIFFRSVWKFVSANIEIGGFQFPFSWLKLIISALILAAMYVAYRLIILGLRKLLAATPAKEKTQTAVLRWSRIALRISYILGVLGIIGWLFGAQVFEYLGKFFGVLSEPLFTAGSTSISFLTLLLTIPVFYVASWVGRMSRSFLDQALFARMGLDASRKFSIASLVRYGVMVIVVLIGLSILGIDLSALAVIFGVLGIGIGFGLQNVVSNFFSGLIIILTRPIKEGDRIIVEGFDATVVHIRLLSTIINTVTEETIIIPNGALVNSTVHNYSYDSRSVIISNIVSVSYRSDIEKVIEVLEAIGRDNPFSFADRPHNVRIVEFGNSGIEMLLRTWIRDVSDKFNAHSWNNLEIWRRFKVENIEIPFPQVDLHVIDQQDRLNVNVEVEPPIDTSQGTIDGGVSGNDDSAV